MIRLYWFIGSQPARAVKALLDIGKIKHTTVEVDIKNNQTRKPQFLKLNPLGQIPFIITETGLGIGESNAIMQYLCQKYPENLLKYYGGGELIARTKINVFLSWYQSYYRIVLFTRIKLKVYGTIKKGIHHTQQQLVQSDKMLEQALKNLDDFLKETPFVCGENPTIPDILIYFETTNLIYYEMEPLLKKYERVSKWYQTMQKIPEIKNIQQKWMETVPAFKQLLASAKPLDQ